MGKNIYNKNEEPIVISKILSDKLLKEKNPSDLMALYWFYYYTAKWQSTNQPKASVNYVAKGLRWGEQKVRKNKKILNSLGLIEDLRDVDKNTGQTKSWYIKVNFIWSEKNHYCKNPQGGKDHRVENKQTNALNTNSINALNTNNTSKEVKESKILYGREDINEIIEIFKSFLGGSLDGSIQINRRYAKHLLDRLGKDYPEENPTRLVGILLKVGLMDDFHSKNLTSTKYLYYNMQKIIQIAKTKGRNKKFVNLDEK